MIFQSIDISKVSISTLTPKLRRDHPSHGQDDTLLDFRPSRGRLNPHLSPEGDTPDPYKPQNPLLPRGVSTKRDLFHLRAPRVPILVYAAYSPLSGAIGGGPNPCGETSYGLGRNRRYCPHGIRPKMQRVL